MVRTIISLKGLIEGASVGAVNIHPDDIILTTALVGSVQSPLSGGDNIFPVPSGTKGVIIIPDPTGTTIKAVKHIGADVGVNLSNTRWTVLNCDVWALNQIIISSVGAESKAITLIFF